MTNLYLVAQKADASTAADVVFVHGLGGNELTTWQGSKSEEDFWPAWLAQDLPGIAVYSLGYDASPSAWLGNAMPLVDRATNVLALLEAEQLGQRPLIFICHSLGGLIVKQLLRTADSLGQASWKNIAECTKAVVFLATPHAGARLADYIGALGRLLRTTTAIEDLHANDPHLRELSQWYSNNAPRLGIDTRAYFETRATAGVRVVDETSANPSITGVVPIPVDADHSSICKPANRDDFVYKSVRQFISRFAAAAPMASITSTSTDAISISLGRPPRFFLSYRRRAEIDAGLAQFLVERLRKAGGEVFIDVDMTVGVEWSKEIERRIEWTDYLVVLLSQDSMSSEMVQAEVRRAHNAFMNVQRKQILPVRIAYTGPLGYELDSYIGKLQYVLWETERDNEHVVAELLRASHTDRAFGYEAAQGVQIEAQTTPSARPEAKADMRLLRESMDAPGARLSHDNPFYIERDTDLRIEEYAKGKARTVVIKGPNQSGKSSLLLRYLAKSVAADKKVGFVDLLTFGAVKTQGFEEFAAQFAEVLIDELEIRNITPPSIKGAHDLTNFVEDEVLSRFDGQVVIAIDEIDRVIDSPWREQFYSELRGWDANRARPVKKAIWGRLGMALAIATDPKMLIESGYTSPFNVTVPITLHPFSRGALDQFNASYKNMLGSAELDRLYSLLNGHPYLTPLAFYRLVYEETTFQQMVVDAALEFGPFGDHLRSRLNRLHNAGLVEAMRTVVINGRVPSNDRRFFYRLDAAGLVREELGRIVPSNEVYARFFKAVL